MAARILIIEDSRDLRDILEMTLRFSGYEVHTASNGREGLEALAAAGPFDLALTDLDMPVMTGQEFIRQCRAGKAPKLPIIALTAESRELIAEALAAGASGSIVKPFEPIVLIETLKKALGG